MSLDPRYAQHLLEGRIPDAIAFAQKKACTAAWKDDYFAPGDVASAEQDVVFRRHDNTIRYVVPWIERVAPLAGAHVIDFGCGCGSSSLALSRFAEKVDAFEIDPVAVEAARTRMKLFRAENVVVHQSTPEMVIHSAADRVRETSVVVLLAVVEHLLEAEQVRYLRTLWKAMEPGQILVIAETPNYYAWLDTHTFQIPFAAMVPDSLFPEFLRRAPETLRFRQSILGDNDAVGEILNRRRRFGVGVTHHVFEQAFDAPLDEIIVSDGFDAPILDWFGVQADDQLLLSGFEVHRAPIPIGFARSVLSFVFRKPRSAADAKAARQWNGAHRQQVIAQYGAFYERRALRQRIRQLEAELAREREAARNKPMEAEPVGVFQALKQRFSGNKGRAQR